eukprot:c26583_g1_i2 orf=496-1290(+)
MTSLKVDSGSAFSISASVSGVVISGWSGGGPSGKRNRELVAFIPLWWSVSSVINPFLEHSGVRTKRVPSLHPVYACRVESRCLTRRKCWKDEKKNDFLLSVSSIGPRPIGSYSAEETGYDSKDLVDSVGRCKLEPDSGEGESRREPGLAGRAVIKVIGVGGGGCNAVNQMVSSALPNVEFWAVNTDVQALSKSLAPHKLQIGPETTYGRGTGGKTDVGEEAATESLAELSIALEGTDLAFIAAGMGGGTGSGAGDDALIDALYF